MLALRFGFWWNSGTVALTQRKATMSAGITPEVPVFGGAPRPFFSYSAERLAWMDNPLRPKRRPVISGKVAVIQRPATMSAYLEMIDTELEAIVCLMADSL